MEVIIRGTKSELMELLAEIRRKDKEYVAVPYYAPTPKPTWTYKITCGNSDVMKGEKE